MIELKFTVSEELSEKDLRDVLCFRHYSSAIFEIKEKIFRILKNGTYCHSFGHSKELDENCIELLEFLQKEIEEICEYLPREY